MEVQTYTRADIMDMNVGWIPVLLTNLGMLPGGDERGRIMAELVRRGLIRDPPLEFSHSEIEISTNPLITETMSDTGRIKMVVSMISMDAEDRSYGIVGNITEEQKDVLFSAVGTYAPERALKVMRWSGMSTGISFEADQLIKLNKDNWPKYPVLTITFMAWD
uniref:Uncharacterized protein n=1 Tax=Pithovirus LCPAC103 TaxID=2506588 RepID=A0A481Z5Q5_9VIRU|nr:MAG: hypothetical protein LCPAC103_01200 [Pithovirus LCPAC103]